MQNNACKQTNNPPNAMLALVDREEIILITAEINTSIAKIKLISQNGCMVLNSYVCPVLQRLRVLHTQFCRVLVLLN